MQFDKQLKGAKEDYLVVSVITTSASWDEQRVIEVAEETVTLEFSYKESGGLFCSHNTILKSDIVSVSVFRLVAK